MARGDHIRVRRTFYWHHGIDAGDGTVIHFSGEPKEKRHAVVRRDLADAFLRGGLVEVVPHADSLPASTVVERALSRLGEAGYSLLFSNCEHFACWCAGVEQRSAQVERTARIAALFGIGIRVASTLARRRGVAMAASKFVPCIGPFASAVAVAGGAVQIASLARSRRATKSGFRIGVW